MKRILIETMVMLTIGAMVLGIVALSFAGVI